MRTAKGFTLIELLIVIAIVGILSAISVPAYIGIQERGKNGAINLASGSATSELQHWMHAVRKAGSAMGNVIEIDTNGDGYVAAPDLSNNNLASNGMITTYTASKTAASPWDGTISLWVSGGTANNQSECDVKAAVNAGQITLCYTPGENASLRMIYMSASDGKGNIIHEKTISAD